MTSISRIVPHFTEGELVTVLIGPDKHPFHVYKQLLCKVPYFDTCLKADWRRDSSKPVEIEDITVNCFRVIVRWLHKDSLGFTQKDDGTTDWEAIAVAYKTADRLMIHQLQNDIIDLHLKCMLNEELSWNITSLQRVKDHGLEHTPYYQMGLRDVVKRFMDSRDTKDILKEDMEELEDGNVLLQEVILRMHDYLISPWDYVSVTNPCTFHVHDKDESEACASEAEYAYLAERAKGTW